MTYEELEEKLDAGEQVVLQDWDANFWTITKIDGERKMSEGRKNLDFKHSCTMLCLDEMFDIHNRMPFFTNRQ